MEYAMTLSGDERGIINDLDELCSLVPSFSKDPHAQEGISERARSTVADEYILREQIGSGATARVYAATQVGNSEVLAVKIARICMKNHIQTEGEVLSGLRHPGIVSLIDRGEGYLVMEYIPKRSLEDALGVSQEFAYSSGLIEELVLPLIEAYQYLESADVLHLDIKPSNFLVDDRESRIKITDFGTQHQIQNRRAKERVGTKLYMSPEQYRGDNMDHRTDIFGLGLLIHEILTGKRAYEENPKDRFNKKLKRNIKQARISFAPSRVPVFEREKADVWQRVVKRATKKILKIDSNRFQH